MEGFYFLGDRIRNGYRGQGLWRVNGIMGWRGEKGVHKGIGFVRLGEAAESRGQDSNRKDPKAFT